jgi:hypothetical protein
MGLGTLLEPNTPLRIFSRPYAGLSLFYANPICIILSKIQLKISQEWKYTLAPHLYKNKKPMGYKYTMNPSNSRFTIFSFLIFLAYIFLDLFV